VSDDVTTPVVPSIAMPGALPDQVPPTGVDESVIGTPRQPLEGVGGVGAGFTVTCTQDLQPVVPSESHTKVVPAIDPSSVAEALTTPEGAIVTIPAGGMGFSTQYIPGSIELSVVVPARHMLSVPVGGAGSGFTVIVTVAAQPVGKV